MKYLLSNPVLKFLLSCTGVFGFYLGFHLINEFEYLGVVMTMRGVRYYFIICSIYIDYLVFNDLNSQTILYRYKNRQKFFTKMIIRENLFLLLFSLYFFLPIVILNTNALIQNWIYIILEILNISIINLFIPSIIRLLDIKTSKRSLSISIVLASIILFDVLSEVLISDIFKKESLLYFYDLFSLPYKLTIPAFFMLMLILCICIFIFTVLFIIQMQKGDYFLKNDETIY